MRVKRTRFKQVFCRACAGTQGDFGRSPSVADVRLAEFKADRIGPSSCFPPSQPQGVRWFRHRTSWRLTCPVVRLFKQCLICAGRPQRAHLTLDRILEAQP